jgi:hypothetical protein
LTLQFQRAFKITLPQTTVKAGACQLMFVEQVGLHLFALLSLYRPSRPPQIDTFPFNSYLFPFSGQKS